MDFNKAWDLILNIHLQNGDKDFYSFKDELKSSIEKSKTYMDFRSDIASRTDLSQDYKWDIECFSESIIAVMALMGKYPNKM